MAMGSQLCVWDVLERPTNPSVWQGDTDRCSPVGRPVVGLDWSPVESTTLAHCSATEVVVWDTRTRQYTCVFKEARHGPVVNSRWNFHNNFLLASAHQGGQVCIWDRRAPDAPLCSVVAHTNKYFGADWSLRQADELVTCGHDNLLRVWQVNFAGKPARFQERGMVHTVYPMSRVLHTPLGDKVITTTSKLDYRDHTVWLWDVVHCTLEREITVPGAAPVKYVALRTLQPEGVQQCVTWGADDTLRAITLFDTGTSTDGSAPATSPRSPRSPLRLTQGTPPIHPSRCSTPPSLVPSSIARSPRRYATFAHEVQHCRRLLRFTRVSLARDRDGSGKAPSPRTNTVFARVEVPPSLVHHLFAGVEISPGIISPSPSSKQLSTPRSEHDWPSTPTSPAAGQSSSPSSPGFYFDNPILRSQNSSVDEGLDADKFAGDSTDGSTAPCPRVGFALQITFPTTYPFEAHPDFDFRLIEGWDYHPSWQVLREFNARCMAVAQDRALRNEHSLEASLLELERSIEQFPWDRASITGPGFSPSAVDIPRIRCALLGSAPPLDPLDGSVRFPVGPRRRRDDCIPAPAFSRLTFTPAGDLLYCHCVPKWDGPIPRSFADFKDNMREYPWTTTVLRNFTYSRTPEVELDASVSLSSVPSLPAHANLGRFSNMSAGDLQEVTPVRRRRSRSHSLPPEGEEHLAQCWFNNRTHLFPVPASYLGYDPRLAEMYTLRGSAANICATNAQAAHAVRRPDLVRLWQTLGRIAQPHVLRGSLAYNPMTRAYVRSALEHYLARHDVQTLALISAVCDLPRRQAAAELAAHRCQRPPRPLRLAPEAPPSVGAEAYCVVAEPESDLGALYDDVLQVTQTPGLGLSTTISRLPFGYSSDSSISKCQSEENCPNLDGTWDLSQSYLSSDSPTSCATPDPREDVGRLCLLDAHFDFLYHRWRGLYALALHRRGRLLQRAELAKFGTERRSLFDSAFGRDRLLSPRLAEAGGHAGKAEALSFLCRVSLCPVVPVAMAPTPPAAAKRSSLKGLFFDRKPHRDSPAHHHPPHASQPCEAAAPARLCCAYCRLPVHGMCAACVLCGCAGHLLHMMEWFEHHSRCPAGCDCTCSMQWNASDP
eukprot:EG_transcript_1082